MPKLIYQPVLHEHEAFLSKAIKRKGFKEKYRELQEEYSLVREMLNARTQSGLTQEAVAKLMGTTKSAVSRLEGVNKNLPSLTTLMKYAKAVGCNLEIKLTPNGHRARQSK